MSLHIGTSGWSYKHWRGNFYPEGLAVKNQFLHYTKNFHTVELNSPFYRLPEKKTFANWHKSAPEGFIFSVKASRYITHMKKLADVKDSLDLFLDNAVELKEKLGPILFQLPPGWQINTERLSLFLQQLPKGLKYTFEFRNDTWYQTEIYELLQEYNCAFCIYDLDGHLSPLVTTTDYVYIRLHGPQKYAGSYSDEVLTEWSTHCKKWLSEKKQIYIYFDNDIRGHAPVNAHTLINLIKE